MMNTLSSPLVVDVAKVFSLNGEIAFKRLSRHKFIATFPTSTGYNIDVDLDENSTIRLTPISIIIYAKKPVHSVRDLLSKDCYLDKVLFNCYANDKKPITRLRIKPLVELARRGRLYKLNCKVYVSRYDAFYNSALALVGRSRYHITLRIENVSFVIAQKKST